MKTELISVVITTYNRSDKIENAIKSVINQTYGNLEIIVVDDNAKLVEERGKTRKIISKFKNIKYIENKDNLGGALSRNVGIENSTANILSFLDDDDEYLPDRIEKMYDLYVSHKNDNVGLIYCNCYRIDSNHSIIGSYENSYNGNPLYNQMLNCIAGTSMWFAPKKVLLKVGMFEQSPCKQDSILLLKILASGYNVYNLNENLVYYYEHGGNGISGIKKKNIEGILKYRKWCEKYYCLLKNDKEINDVRYNFSKQLVTLYVLNNMSKEAKDELKNMRSIKLFSLNTLKVYIKYYFPSLYKKKIGVVNSEKQN